MATTQVEAALIDGHDVEECTVFGVEVPGTGGRAGMAAIKLRDGAEFDGKALAQAALPQAAHRMRCRCSCGLSESLEHTSTFKSRKVDLREQAYGPDVTDPLYVLAGRDEGYVQYYEGYAEEVADGKRPRG